MFLRNHNGDLSNSWKHSGAEAAMMNITTVVFGATGFVGKYINGIAAQHKHTIICPFRFRSGVGGGIRCLRHQGDGTFGQIFPTDYEIDKEFVVKAILEKCEHVFNAIGVMQEPHAYENSSSWFSSEAINIEWPRMLARWSREMGVNRFVHMSMVGADVNSPSRMLRQRALAEQAVLEEFPRATIIRATDMFAEDDWSYHRYLRAQRNFKITPVPNMGQRIHQPVFVGDVAEAAVRSILLDHTEGKIAELGGPVRWTTNDFLRWCAEVNAQYHYTIALPKWMWKGGCWLNEHFFFRKGALIGGKEPTWNLDWLERQFLDNVAMPERNPDLLDWEDFGIPREDLYRLEEKYFRVSMMWTKEGIYLENGRYL